MPHPAYYDEASEVVRFWVPVGERLVGASVSRQTLHYRYCPQAHGESHLETYEAHASELESAVRHRLAQGCLEPVMLRDFDLRVVPA